MTYTISLSGDDGQTTKNMSCKICGRGACASWMHSISEQEKYDEHESVTDDVDKLRREVQELRGDVAKLKAENETLRESSIDSRINK
jgi:hypothetical protein